MISSQSFPDASLAARAMPELLSPEWELQLAVAGNRPALPRDETFDIFPKG